MKPDNNILLYKKITLLPILLMAIVCCACLFSSCNNDDNDAADSIIDLIVASKQDTVNNVPTLVVKSLHSDLPNNWFCLSNDIKGFEYEEGYEYQLKIKLINQPAESSKSATYELIKIISKEKKETIFYQKNWQIYNIASHLEGEKLSSSEIEELENKIKAASPFIGVNYIDLYCTEINSDNYNRKGTCKFSNKETGLYMMEDMDKYLTFILNGKAYRYEIKTIDSKRYLLRDVTSEYKTDYPNLESALSGIEFQNIIF